MFDWDKDQEDLVGIGNKPPAVGTQSRQSGLRSKLGFGLLGAVIVLGFAYEKDMLLQTRAGSTFALGMFGQAASAPLQDALPEGLLAYDNAQARRYLRGLRLADTATLHGYAARLQSDLVQADPLLAPFLRDAKTLVLSELAQRGG